MKLHHQKLRTYITILLAFAFVMSIPISSSIQWGEDILLTTDPHSDFSPSITQTNDGKIRIFWHSDRLSTLTVPNTELFFKTYNGQTWTADTRLTYSAGHDVNPAVFTTPQGTMWLVWSSNRTGIGPNQGYYELFYMTSTNNGASWSTATQLTNNPNAKDARPAIMQAANGLIWIVWQSNPTGNEDLYYRTFDGVSWSSETQLTFNSYPDITPAIMQSRDGKIWIFYGAVTTAHPTQYEIYYKTSTDNGASWSTETRLTNHNAWDILPTATQTTDGVIRVVWEADRSGQDDDLYYKTYDGTTWSNDDKLTGQSVTDDIHPSIFQAENKTIWVAFASNRMDDMDIWVKTAKSLIDAGVVEVTVSSVYAYRGYGTTVYVTLRNFGTSTLTFPVTAYYSGNIIQTQTVSNLASGAVTTLTYTWKASDVPLGFYTISASTGTISGEEDPNDNSLTNGTVEVRFPGDVNGDTTVNIYDAILISTYFGRPEEFPAGDINNNGAIDIADAAILSLNYGLSG